MALENLFIRTNRSIAGIKLDAVISESYTNKVRITRNPVELGAEITDHSIIEPKRIVIIADVTDTPFGLASIGAIVDTVTGLFGTTNSSNVTRSTAAYLDLVAIQEKREPISVQTKLKNYTNLLITEISTVKDKDTARIVNLIITLDELLIVESETVTLTANQLAAGTTRQQAVRAANLGRQSAITPDDLQTTSTLKILLDLVGLSP